MFQTIALKKKLPESMTLTRQSFAAQSESKTKVAACAYTYVPFVGECGGMSGKAKASRQIIAVSGLGRREKLVQYEGMKGDDISRDFVSSRCLVGKFSLCIANSLW